MPPRPRGAKGPTESGPELPKLAALLDEAEEDVLAYMTFPKQHRAEIDSTNPLERLDGEIKRRTDVVGLRRLTRASLPTVAA
jgi:transposase-like protein